MTSSMLAGERRWNSARRGGMIVLGKVAAPKPLNLPSQRLENHGLDPNVEIVPKGTLTWGSKPSTVANAWGGSLNNNNSGRPSSAGSSSRPSTGGSEKIFEPGLSARGPNSRPSSASGSLTSSQTSAASLRPHSSETRPGASQLSRFAESPSGRSVPWSATGAPRRSEELLTKGEEFSLAGGDFPRLGTEKLDPGKTTQTRGGGCEDGPAEETGEVMNADGTKQFGTATGNDGWRHHAGSVPQQHEVECWHGGGNGGPVGVPVAAGGYWFRGPPPPPSQGFPYGVVPFHPEQYHFYGARVPFIAANPNVRPSMHGGEVKRPCPDGGYMGPPIMGPGFGYPGGVLTSDGFYVPYPPSNSNGCLWRPHRQQGGEMDGGAVKILRDENSSETDGDVNNSATLIQKIECLNAKARLSGSPSKATDEQGSRCRLLLSKSSSSSDENGPRVINILHNKKAKPTDVVQEDESGDAEVDEGTGMRVADIGDGQAQRALMRQLAKKRAKQRQEEEEQREKEQKAKALAKLEELNRRIESDEALPVDEESVVLPQQISADSDSVAMPATSVSASAVGIDPKPESEKQRSRPVRRNHQQRTRARDTAVVWALKKKEEASVPSSSSAAAARDGGKRVEMERYAPKSRESAAPPSALSANPKIEFGSLKDVKHDASSALPESVRVPPPLEPLKTVAAAPPPSEEKKGGQLRVTARRNHKKDGSHHYNNHNPVAAVKQPHASGEVHSQDVRAQWKPKAQHHQYAEEPHSSVSRSKKSSGAAADGRAQVPLSSEHVATAVDPHHHKQHHRSSASFHRRNGARRPARQADENDVHTEYQPIHRGGAATVVGGRTPPRHRY